MPKVSGTPSLISWIPGRTESSKKLHGQVPGEGGDTTVVNDHDPPPVKVPPLAAVALRVAV
jgi:hypothetical protein